MGKDCQKECRIGSAGYSNGSLAHLIQDGRAVGIPQFRHAARLWHLVGHHFPCVGKPLRGGPGRRHGGLPHLRVHLGQEEHLLLIRGVVVYGNNSPPRNALLIQDELQFSICSRVTPQSRVCPVRRENVLDGHFNFNDAARMGTELESHLFTGTDAIPWPHPQAL